MEIATVNLSREIVPPGGSEMRGDGARKHGKFYQNFNVSRNDFVPWAKKYKDKD